MYNFIFQRMMALYVASHYKNSPNDLQLMADAPSHHLFVLLGIVCLLLVPITFSQGEQVLVLIFVRWLHLFAVSFCRSCWWIKKSSSGYFMCYSGWSVLFTHHTCVTCFNALLVQSNKKEILGFDRKTWLMWPEVSCHINIHQTWIFFLRWF